MKKTITLYSVNPNQYPNREIEVEVIDNPSEMIDQISAQEVVTAKKTAKVQARRAQVGEVVDTRPRVEVDGKQYTFSETKQTITPEKAANGAIIVTNPDGEEYVISSMEKFEKKYAATPQKGFYVAIDSPKKFRVSTGNYAIQASWGEEQIVLEGSLFCVEKPTDIYGITNSAFNSTYKVTQKELPNQFGE